MSAIDHPYPKMQRLLQELEPGFYADCLKELEANQSLLNFSQVRYAQEIIAGMAWLEKNRDALSLIPNEEARNRLITDETSLVAEPGLLPGDTVEEVKNIVALRIDTFKNAFLFDKSRGATPAFFAYAFVGPPCFNGRLITLQEYILREQQGVATYAFERNLSYDNEACTLEEILYKLQDPSSEKVKEYLEIAQHPLAKHPQFESIYKRAYEFYTT